MTTQGGTLLVVLAVCFSAVTSQQSIAAQPADTASTLGASTTIRCSIANKQGFLSWTKDGDPISAESSIIDQSNTRYSVVGDGSMTFDLQINDVMLSDSGEFQCLVTSGGGGSTSLASNIATLTVLQIQSFLVEPSATNVARDATATLRCQIDNKEGSLYWLKDGVVISNDTTVTNDNPRYSIVGDASSGTYDLQIVSAAEAVDDGDYQCVVTAAGTSEMIESQIAALTVQGSGQRLSIVPTNAVFTEGTVALMRCRVDDQAGTVSWLQNSQPISYDGEISNGDARYSIVGAVTGDFNLEISSVQPADQGTYHCVVGAASGPGNGGISSSGASVIVLPATAPEEAYPVCTMTPSSDLREGDNLTISCASRGGEPQPGLEWLRDGTVFTGGVYTAGSQSARNDATFTLTNELIGSLFECVGTHPAYVNTQKCELPPLVFELTPTISVNLDLLSLEIREDATGSVICSASGDPPVLGYQWYYNGVAIAGTDERFVTVIDGANTESTLTIVSASLSMDESVVSCEARNRVDSESVYSVVRIIEDDLYQIVLAVLALVAFFVLLVIIVPLVAYYCYHRHNKNLKIAPLDDSPLTISGTKVPHNVTPTPNTLPLPNGVANHSTPPSPQQQPVDYDDDDKDYPMEVSYSPTPLPELRSYRARPYAPPILPQPVPSQSPDGFPPMDSMDSTRSIHMAGSYDVEAAGIRGGGGEDSKTPAPLSSRRSSMAKFSQSPGDFMMRTEYERKVKELESMQKSLTASGMIQDDVKSRKSRDGGEKRKHKHKKKDRERDERDDNDDADSPKKSTSKDHKEHKKDKKGHKDKKEKKEKKEKNK